MLSINKFFICTRCYLSALMEVIFIENLFKLIYIFFISIFEFITCAKEGQNKMSWKRHTRRNDSQNSAKMIISIMKQNKKNHNLIWQQFPVVFVHGKMYLLKMLLLIWFISMRQSEKWWTWNDFIVHWFRIDCEQKHYGIDEVKVHTYTCCCSL